MVVYHRNNNNFAVNGSSLGAVMAWHRNIYDSMDDITEDKSTKAQDKKIILQKIATTVNIAIRRTISNYISCSNKLQTEWSSNPNQPALY